MIEADEYDHEVDAARMLNELDFPSGAEHRDAILAAFSETLDPIRQMLWAIRVRRDAHPQQKFGVVHLMTRSLSDLLAGGHLAAHCYLSQAYSVLRPVIDSCDLIELFAQDPEQATLWTVTEKAHIEFAPTRVRKLIGREKLDPVHSHFSESGSHPRFTGARLSGGMRVAVDDPEDRTAFLRIGPMWPEHFATLLIWPFTFQLAVQLAGYGHHLIPLADDPKVAEVEWRRRYIASIDAATSGTTLVLDLLGEPADSETRKLWSDGRAVAQGRLDQLEDDESRP